MKPLRRKLLIMTMLGALLTALSSNLFAQSWRKIDNDSAICFVGKKEVTLLLNNVIELDSLRRADKKNNALIVEKEGVIKRQRFYIYGLHGVIVVFMVVLLL